MKSFKLPLLHSIIPLAVSIIGLTQADAQTVLFSDNFSDALSQWHFANTSGAGAAWTTTTSGFSNPPMNGTVMKQPAGSAANTLALAQFSTTTLNQVGESLAMTFDFQTTALDTSGQLGIYLVNTAATLSGNYIGVADPISDADGYGYTQNYSTTFSAGFRKVTNDTNVSSNATTGSINAGDGLAHVFVMTLTLETNGTEVSMSIDGQNLTPPYLDASSAYTTFNTIKLASNQAAYIDNLSVDLIPVPEPGAGMLGFLGASLMIPAWRRKVRTS